MNEHPLRTGGERKELWSADVIASCWRSLEEVDERVMRFNTISLASDISSEGCSLSKLTGSDFIAMLTARTNSSLLSFFFPRSWLLRTHTTCQNVSPNTASASIAPLLLTSASRAIASGTGKLHNFDIVYTRVFLLDFGLFQNIYILCCRCSTLSLHVLSYVEQQACETVKIQKRLRNFQLGDHRF